MRHEVAHPIPSLDGLRAVSISLVVLGHATGSKGFFLGMKALPFLGPLVGLGVNVFFVISGFLITGILLREMEKPGGLRLSKFYLRRTLRIFPPYYFYLVVMLGLTLFKVVEIPMQNFAFAATYIQNYSWVKWNWLLGHSWSLSIEEQFYLLWPGALLLMGKRGVTPLLWGLIVLCPFLRAATYHWHIMSEGIALHFGSHAAADSLATGCLLAFTRDWLHQKHLYLRIMESRLFFVVPLVAIALSLIQVSYPLFCALIAKSAINFAIALSIDWCVTNYKSWAGRILNSTPMVFIGVISYSLYIWQEPFLRHDNDQIINYFPQNVLLAFICAVISYYTVERYSFKVRRKLEQRWLHIERPEPAHNQVLV
jgi:peptidoglycan/LPS O-acetylase OafA/YrhL